VFKQIVAWESGLCGVKMITSTPSTHKNLLHGHGRTSRTRFSFLTTGRFAWWTANGKEVGKFARQVPELRAEHVPAMELHEVHLPEEQRGWKGFGGRSDTSIYSVAPMARLNAAGRHGYAAKAQAAYRGIFQTLAASRSITKPCAKITGRA